MVSRKKLYSLFCYAEISLGIILIIFTFIELFLYQIFYDFHIIKNIYVIFLGIGGILGIIGGLFSLGILSIAGCLPSLICMLILINDMYFWYALRFDVLIFLILSIIFGILLIIFYKEEKYEMKSETKDLKLNELKKIKKRQIEKLNMIGIFTLKELIDEEDNLKEIVKLTDIDKFKLKVWVKEAKSYEKQYDEYKKQQLKKSYWKIKKMKK